MSLHLHSIMYLLIRDNAEMVKELYEFTFHNVSINSTQSAIINRLLHHLHSIMYLLIPVLQLPLYHL